MAEWPASYAQPMGGHVISASSPESLGVALVGITGQASASWPVANTAYFVPFVLSRAITIAQMFCLNGTAVSGNVDVGIYSADGARLVSSGSTAQSGTSTIQLFDIADTTIGPGQFYLAMVMDNTTGTHGRFAPAASAVGRALGVLEMASAFPLSATVTFAALSSASIPMVGATPKAVV